jgi:hypothetical protein
MSRTFQLNVTVNADLSFSDAIFVEDGDDVRFHDVAIVLERLLQNVRNRGSEKVATKSQVAAEQLKLDAANAILKDWDRTNDGVNTNMIMGGATTYSCTWVKKGQSEPVDAPCNGDGSANFATADALSKWVAPELPIAEA